MRQETVATMQRRPRGGAADLTAQGDLVVVEAGELIPGDGEIEGIASVDESAITGESAPVIRERGGDRSARDRRHACALRPDRGRDHAGPGESFLDRMIALVEGAERQKTPNEIALNILLAGADADLPVVAATLRPFGLFAGTRLGDRADRAAGGA